MLGGNSQARSSFAQGREETPGFLADLSYARQMAVFSRVSAEAVFLLFCSRVNAIFFSVFFDVFLVFFFVFLCFGGGVFVLLGFFFVCFSRVSANFFLGLFFSRWRKQSREFLLWN